MQTSTGQMIINLRQKIMNPIYIFDAIITLQEMIQMEMFKLSKLGDISDIMDIIKLMKLNPYNTNIEYFTEKLN